jgi:hypothetical protein
MVDIIITTEQQHNNNQLSLGIIVSIFMLLMIAPNAYSEPQLIFSQNDIEQKVVQPTPPDNRLRIVCPQCKRALYKCNLYELFDGDNRLYNGACKSFYPVLPELKKFVLIHCPYDGYSPFRTVPSPGLSSHNSTVYTNRGWQPRQIQDPRLRQQFNEWIAYIKSGRSIGERDQRWIEFEEWSIANLQRSMYK